MQEFIPAKILVVDDDDDIRLVTARALRQVGHEVVTASNGADGIAVFQREKPDLALLDVVIGEDDGVELCRTLKSMATDDRSVFVLLISGTRTLSDQQAHGLGAGADGYMARPIPNKELVARVESMLRIKRAEDELHKSRQMLRQLAAHIETAREEERAAVARDLHDIVGQSTTALMLDVEWLLAHSAEGDKEALDRLNDMSSVLQTLMETTKRMTMDLRPTVLDDLGIPAAMDYHAEAFKSRHGIQCTIEAEDIPLTVECRTLMFRVFQEILTTVAVHSNATRVGVSFKAIDDKCVLTIRDNGTNPVTNLSEDPRSIGLLGLKERIMPFGGRLEVSADDSTGTTFTISASAAMCTRSQDT